MNIIVILCILGFVVLSVTFIVRWICRKSKKWIGLSALFCVAGVVIFSLIGTALWVGEMSDDERKALIVTTPSSVPSYAPVVEKPVVTNNPSIAPPPPIVVPTVISTEEDLFYKGDTVEGILMTIDTNIVSELMNAGYSVREAADIQLILNTLGITTIRIENMSGIPSSGLNAVVCYPNEYTDRGRRFYFTTEDGVVFYAGFRGEDLYDTDRGGFLKSYDEVHVQETSVDLETYTLLQGYAIEAVKPFLSYPSSADFKLLSWGIGRSDDRYKIIGKVSAKNSFGVKRDIPFGVWFMKEGDGFMIEGIVIDSNRVK